MKCYYHPDADAVGICKDCNKGICPACAVDVGRGLACRGECEENVRRINDLIGKNTASVKRAPGTLLQSFLIYAVLGIFLIVLGFDLINTRMGPIFIAFGMVFILLGLISYLRGRRIFKG